MHRSVALRRSGAPVIVPGTSCLQHSASSVVLVRPPHGRAAVTCSALPDWMRSLMDFQSWAPKSTRIWRLQQYEYPSNEADDVDQLQAKINKMSSNPDASGGAGGAAVASSPRSSGPQASSQLDTLGELPPSGSFAEAGDDTLARALSQRLQVVAAAEPVPEQQQEQEVEPGVPAVVPLTGMEMRQLILSKYGKTYDISFVRRDIPGKTFVGLNIMWQHLEQRSFRLTEEQYMEKIDSVAYLLNVLGQTNKVRTFLLAPPKSQNGLPKRPVVGTAISIQMNLDKEVIDEFFGKGYQ